MRFWMASGPSIPRAPENDGGASDDLDEDFSLDPPEDDLEDDEPPEDDVDDLTGLDDLDEDEQPARAPSRGENRVAVATREAKEAKEKADRLEREIAEIRASSRPQTQQETPAQREQRLAAMDPYERLQFELNETRQQTLQFQQRLEFQQADANDRVEYAQLCAEKPIAAKLKDEVESRLADMRKAGTTAPRATVLRWVIGDRAIANAGKATGKAKAAAARNRQEQSARPAQGRGDAKPDGRDKGQAARDKRLESYNL